jgi:hypothetical protein
MTTPTKTKIGLAWAAALVGLLAVTVQAWGAGLSGMYLSASLPSTSVSLPPPPVLVPPPPVLVPLPPVLVPPPPVLVPLPPVLVPPPPVLVPLPPVLVPPPPVHVTVPPVLVSPPPVHVTVPPVSEGPSGHVTIPRTPSIPVSTPRTPSTSGIPAGLTPSARGVTRSPSVSQRSSGTATNQSQTNAFASSGQGSLGAGSPSSGYSFSGGSIKLDTATSRALGRLSRPERARVLLLIATVQRLKACLGNLPDRLRLVLELATGINAPRALSSAELAHYLHVRVGRIPRLEKQALGRLRVTARTQTCGGATQTLPGLLAPSMFGPAVGNDGSAASGVEAVRYSKSPREPVKQASPRGNLLLGIDIAYPASGATLIVLLVLAGLLSIGLLFADQLGIGPRHQEWRSRWMRRPPWT